MKKYFILAAAAILTIAACSKNEVDNEAYEQSRIINFNTVTGKATTKAGPINDNYFPHDAGNFGVYAYYLASGTWSANFASSKLYMGTADADGDAEDATAGVTVTFNNDLYIWNPTPVYYWPLQGTLTFFAYYPLNLNTPKFDLSAKQFSIGSFTVNHTPASQVEVLVSSFAENRNANENQYEDANDNSGENLGVPIAFNHTLSQVVFTAAAAADVYAQNLSFKVNDITVGARATSAGMTVVPSGTPSWTAPTGLDTFDILSSDFPSSGYLDDDQSEQIGESLLMIPNADFVGGEGIADDDYFTVTYTLYRTTDNLSLGQKTVKLYFNDNKTSPVTNWEPGKRYTYQLTIGLTKIYFAPTVTDWTDAAAQPVTVPGNGTTI